MKTRIITLLLAISAIIIGGAYAQTKIKVHKGGEVIYSVPLTDVDSVGFAKVSSSVHNGHEFVDLGLPSGTKWATCNVGATTPEGFGNYYAWAETSPKDYYSWDNYIYCDGIGSRITKYATGYSYSQDPDGLTDLEMSDDVARVDWGGSWRIPTEEEMTELFYNCNWTWVTQNGISGYKVTSTVNGNSIFLPATGAKGDGYVSNQEYAYYWTNSIRDYVNNSANALYYIKAYAPTSTGNLSRCSGASIRAVCNIEGGNTQTKVAIYKEDDVIYSRPIAEIDSIKFEREYNGISTEKYYRIKNVESGLYLNAVNYDFHYTGSFGGVNCTAYAQDADQIFKFEVSGDKFKVITNSGYYLYCQKWIVDAQTAGVDLSFVKNDDETYDIMFGESYFAVDELNGYYYPFCNATEGEKATWVLEEATPLPTYTVSVSATEGGTTSASVNSMAQGGSVTLFATPESGYRFVNWTVNGSEVSTENIFVATITANTEFVANFEERTTESGISLTKEYRIKDVASGCYLNIANNYIHSGGTNGGVNCVAYAENNNQIFVFEASGTNYYLKSKSGYYIYCQQWNVDGLTYGSELTFIDNPDGTYYIKNGANYFKVEDVNGVYYPFCDAPADLRATWILEQVGGEEPEPIPTYTVSVSATEGGTVTTSAESVEEGGSVILTATPETGYRFVNWTLNNNVVSVSNPFIATITANSEFVANFEAEENQSGELHNGHEYVDLGLPSGLKWATCNVGATAPEEYGNNYAWGETTPQSWLATEYTYNDNPEVLPLSADAANVNWGGNWRMPTYEEIGELEDTNNCTWTWTTQNGVSGYKVTSKKNGNSIFLPGAANSGYYWSSSAYPGSTFYAYCLMFTSVSVNCDYSQRNYGQSVRAVFGEKQSFTVSVSATEGGTATASASSVEQGGSVTLTATANSGYVFKNWTLGGEVVSTENPYTVTVTANSEFVANFEAEENQSGELHNGHEYVDLGLPSGLKWATCNVGATTPEEYGSYFAWGETEPKATYDLSNYKWCNGTADSMTKYCTDSEYGIVDNKTTLELSDDAARVNWGGSWRMPTKAEQDELMDTDNCTWEWTTQNEVNGYKVTSKKNGNSIFLPAAGLIVQNRLVYADTEGNLWSSSNDGDYSAHNIGFYSGGIQWYQQGRELGQSVRAVFGEKQTFTVSVSALTGGSATASAESVEDGSTVTLTATANEGYNFRGWSLDGVLVSTENPYTVTVTANSEYLASFEEITYTVSVSSTTGGSATASAESIAYGSSVILTATPDEGYVFKNWTLDGEVVSTDNPYTTTVTKNSEFVANFEEGESSGEDNEPIICTVSVGAASTDGSATASATSVEQGGTVILTATPNEGYEFKYWKDLMGDDVLSTDNPYVATVTQNTTFEACFKPKKFTVTVSSTEGGTAQTSSTIVDYAWKVTLTATPDPGYKFIGWEENGVMVGDDSDQVWTLYIYENRKFTAKFEKLGIVGAHNGYEYVDLGLSVKWATCNVGATEPENIGGYVAWGETSSKDSYTSGNYTYSANPATLPLSADVANSYMGGNWRMPTADELQELIDNCTWTTLGSGATARFKITSDINGNSIIIPAVGYQTTGTSSTEAKAPYLLLWSSSINADNNGQAKILERRTIITNNVKRIGNASRYNGLPVRAVLDSETVSITVSATEGGVVNSRYSTVAKGESITLVATPKSGYNFKNWTLNGTVVSTSSTYTGTVTTNSNFVANFEQTTENGHVYVDLGLSVKWATCNVGATKAEEEGDYFAWGETETKEIYNWETYKWCNGTYDSMTKYCTDSSYGTVDNKTILDIEDDAARANWGGTWRMPTEAEIEEMEENCIFTKTTLNGVNGWTITSKINGNSIFVPVNGHYEDGNLKHEEYNFASTWSSSYYDYGNYRATTFRIVSHLGASYEYRCEGYPVRAVCE